MDNNETQGHCIGNSSTSNNNSSTTSATNAKMHFVNIGNSLVRYAREVASQEIKSLRQRNIEKE